MSRILRNVRRFPPLLRIASIAGLLFALAAVALLAPTVALKQLPTDFNRELGIGANLGMLSGACSIVINAYGQRFRPPDSGLFFLNSLQSQVVALALLAALPLCALVVALILPPVFPAFIPVPTITCLAAFVLLAAHVWTTTKAASRRPMRTPR